MSESESAAPVFDRTYHQALLEAVAHKTLRQHSSQVLKRHGLNATQWIILGYLSEHAKGMRVTDLADLLRVEVPLVTIVTRPLSARGLVAARAHRKDKRSKLLRLTDAARLLIPEIEAELAARLRRSMRGVSDDDMQAYLRVLGVIAAGSTAEQNA